MATFSDLSLRNRIFMATYRYRRVDPVPFVASPRPLGDARVALLGRPGQGRILEDLEN